MRSSLVLGLMIAPSMGLACLVPPPHLFRDHDALLNEATHVLLVEAKAAARPGGACRLEVLRSWKAKAPQIVPVQCKAPTENDWMTDFDAHTDDQFWKSRDGRLGVNGDCTVLPPAFMVGKRYVVLLGVAPDLKQFEQVASEGDRWLEFVERRFAVPAPTKTPNRSVGAGQS